MAHAASIGKLRVMRCLNMMRCFAQVPLPLKAQIIKEVKPVEAVTEEKFSKGTLVEVSSDEEGCESVIAGENAGFSYENLQHYCVDPDIHFHTVFYDSGGNQIVPALLPDKLYILGCLTGNLVLDLC
ncbi:hypothetical protein GH714_006317 [Hevea brasiliensis]|uniref:Uncharacterized protein n=1 Tax=Hevea brasiliensis TaxID=3981 RepID=A0A6A6NFW2_HEVBR|nr:hypothetical protein GH714_006317 [Hevea brasiliensis]